MYSKRLSTDMPILVLYFNFTTFFFNVIFVFRHFNVTVFMMLRQKKNSRTQLTTDMSVRYLLTT